MLAAANCESLEPGARLEFHVGWSGWTRPPTTEGGVGREMGWCARGFLARRIIVQVLGKYMIIRYLGSQGMEV